jgi:hypothetical protein
LGDGRVRAAFHPYDRCDVCALHVKHDLNMEPPPMAPKRQDPIRQYLEGNFIVKVYPPAALGGDFDLPGQRFAKPATRNTEAGWKHTDSNKSKT